MILQLTINRNTKDLWEKYFIDEKLEFLKFEKCQNWIVILDNIIQYDAALRDQLLYVQSSRTIYLRQFFKFVWWENCRIYEHGVKTNESGVSQGWTIPLLRYLTSEVRKTGSSTSILRWRKREEKREREREREKERENEGDTGNHSMRELISQRHPGATHLMCARKARP